MGHHKSKTAATWIAIVGGGLGLHRFYLAGIRDPWGWLYPAPTLLGLLGALRARELGVDDRLSWVLIPLLGFALAAAMLSAIIYGLTSDDRWHLQYNADEATPRRSGWLAVIGVVLALMIGATVLMATIAFSSQRIFEYEVERARKISR